MIASQQIKKPSRQRNDLKKKLLYKKVSIIGLLGPDYWACPPAAGCTGPAGWPQPRTFAA